MDARAEEIKTERIAQWSQFNSERIAELETLIQRSVDKGDGDSTLNVRRRELVTERRQLVANNTLQRASDAGVWSRLYWGYSAKDLDNEVLRYGVSGVDKNGVRE